MPAYLTALPEERSRTGDDQRPMCEERARRPNNAAPMSGAVYRSGVEAGSAGASCHCGVAGLMVQRMRSPAEPDGIDGELLVLTDPAQHLPISCRKFAPVSARLVSFAPVLQTPCCSYACGRQKPVLTRQPYNRGARNEIRKHNQLTHDRTHEPKQNNPAQCG